MQEKKPKTILVKKKAKKKKLTTSARKSIIADTNRTRPITEKMREARRKNLEKTFLAKGKTLPHKSPVRRDLPELMVDKRLQALLTKEFIGGVISNYTMSTLSQVRAIANHKDASMLERTICKIIIKAYETNDFYRLEWLLQRSIGKVSDKLELSKPTEFSNMTLDELKQRHHELSEKNRIALRDIEAKEIEAQTIALSLKDYKDVTVDGEDTSADEPIDGLEYNPRH